MGLMAGFYREDDLRSFFIVSQARIERGDIEGGRCSDDVEGILVKVSSASGDKCERCWVYDVTVGQQPDHPTICNRCIDSLQAIGQS